MHPHRIQVLNGADDGSATTVVDPVSVEGKLAIGAHGGSPSRYFSGLIDEVRIYNRALSAAEVKQLYLAGRVNANTSQNIRFRDSSLVGEWSFDGPDVSFTANKAYDRSGQSNDGTLTNMSTSTAPVIGRIGQALSFDGSNDLVTVSNDTNFNVSNGTFGLWFRSDGGWGVDGTSGGTTVKGSTVLIGRHDASGSQNGNLLILSSTGLPNYVAKDATATVCSALGTASITDNKWHYYAATFGQANATVARVYIDGIQVATCTNSAAWSYNNQNVLIADSNDPWWEEFAGLIDDVRVYNRALTAAEVKQLYLLGR